MRIDITVLLLNSDNSQHINQEILKKLPENISYVNEPYLFKLCNIYKIPTAVLVNLVNMNGKIEHINIVKDIRHLKFLLSDY
ncbi:hypothetical protein CULT_60028 [[Clostridium] ultunense Esp]|nr:hypothetical protein CULT_60028 [[Clostridium] ultunense Esp]